MSDNRRPLSATREYKRLFVAYEARVKGLLPRDDFLYWRKVFHRAQRGEDDSRRQSARYVRITNTIGADATAQRILVRIKELLEAEAGEEEGT